jgi:hypothetical protein
MSNKVKEKLLIAFNDKKTIDAKQFGAKFRTKREVYT